MSHPKQYRVTPYCDTCQEFTSTEHKSQVQCIENLKYKNSKLVERNAYLTGQNSTLQTHIQEAKSQAVKLVETISNLEKEVEILRKASK